VITFAFASSLVANFLVVVVGILNGTRGRLNRVGYGCRKMKGKGLFVPTNQQPLT